MNKKKLHVLFLPLWYPSDGFTGVSGTFCQEHVMAVKDHVDMSVLHHYNDPSSKGFNYEWKESDEHGYKKIDSISQFSFVPKTHWLLWQYTYQKSLIRYIRTYGAPDIMHANDDMAYGAIKIAKEHDIPVVVSQHWTKLLQEGVGPIENHMFRYIFKHADAIMPVFNATGSEYKHKGFVSDRIIWLPNTYDENVFYPAFDQEKDYALLHVSNLTPQKRVKDILKAFAIIVKNDSKIKLNIVGGSKELIDNYLAYAMDCAIPSRQITFYGHQSKQKVASMMRTTGAFVFASDFETFGCVLMEAKASGAPIITTRAGGIKSVLQEDEALNFETKDVDRLVALIQQAIDGNHSLDLVRNAESAKLRFSRPAVGKQLLRIYQKFAKTA